MLCACSIFPTHFTRSNCFITNKFLTRHNPSTWPLNIINTDWGTQPPLLLDWEEKYKTWIEVRRASLDVSDARPHWANTCVTRQWLLVSSPRSYDVLLNHLTMCSLSLNSCQMCLCWVSGWQKVTESHRECHFNSGNYLDKKYNLEMLLNFSFCSREKLCEDKLWRSIFFSKWM